MSKLLSSEMWQQFADTATRALGCTAPWNPVQDTRLSVGGLQRRTRAPSSRPYTRAHLKYSETSLLSRALDCPGSSRPRSGRLHPKPPAAAARLRLAAAPVPIAERAR